MATGLHRRSHARRTSATVAVPLAVLGITTSVNAQVPLDIDWRFKQLALTAEAIDLAFAGAPCVPGPDS